MVRPHVFLAIAALFGLTTYSLPSLAQAQRTQPQPFSPSSITSSPTVEQMLQNPKDGQPQTTVALRGYVGPSAPEVVRLYWDLTLTRYFEIPRNAIIQQVQGQDPKNDPVTLYVRSSTPIVTANSLSVDVAAAQRMLIESFGNASGGGSGLKFTSGTDCIIPGAACFAGMGAGACVFFAGCWAGAHAQ
jgi:hypothetical protein